MSRTKLKSREPTHHVMCVSMAKKAIDNVFSDTTVDKRQTDESLHELRNYITDCIQALLER